MQIVFRVDGIINEFIRIREPGISFIELPIVILEYSLVIHL